MICIKLLLDKHTNMNDITYILLYILDRKVTIKISGVIMQNSCMGVTIFICKKC